MIMREIILDTETTGLSPATGDRIVEIGAVELINHIPSGKTYHVYLNPERDMPKEAEAVHGLSAAFLKDKPLFKHISTEFLAFIGDAPLIIHNASFDMGFINAELGFVGLPAIPPSQVIDTLQMARRTHPMGSNSLDALCKRYGIDNSKRTKHGALLDAELLADVYLELIGGRQTALTLQAQTTIRKIEIGATRHVGRSRPEPLSTRLTEEESALHRTRIAELGDKALWGLEP
jgi:DNA polymerase III subunit epsilon